MRLPVALGIVITITPKTNKLLHCSIQESYGSWEKISTRTFGSLAELQGYLVEFTALNTYQALMMIVRNPARIWPACARLKIRELHFDKLPW